MKHFTYLKTFAAMMVMMAALSVGSLSAKPYPVPKMYMFGFAASFTDTIVYFTNVMEVENVWIEGKNKFLLGRSTYSHQLRDYLGQAHQMPMRTCVVMYDEKRANLEKKLIKMKKLYTKSKDKKAHFDIRYLADNEFRFKAIDWQKMLDEAAAEEAAKQKEEAKASDTKKKEKKAKKKEAKE
ncbi:MAG: hypothetical protein J6I52_11585 [Prevotella sp.]|nr:hypothetical protein [Prevotella sp.]